MNKQDSNSAVAINKPRPKDFQTMMVVRSNGATVTADVYGPLIGNSTGRERNKILKQNGMKAIYLHESEKYKAAKDAYYAEQHATSKEQASVTIEQAFEQAGAQPVKRVATILRGMLPLFKTQQQPKTVKAFAAIIKQLMSAGIVQDLSDREARLAEKADKKSKGNKGKTGDAAEGNGETATA